MNVRRSGVGAGEWVSQFCWIRGRSNCYIIRFLTGNDYKSLSKLEQEHLDSVLKQVEGAVEQGH
eukprot:5021676-Amphidinium_carterae.1